MVLEVDAVSRPPSQAHAPELPAHNSCVISLTAYCWQSQQISQVNLEQGTDEECMRVIAAWRGDGCLVGMGYELEERLDHHARGHSEAVVHLVGKF